MREIAKVVTASSAEELNEKIEAEGKVRAKLANVQYKPIVLGDKIVFTAMLIFA